MPPFGVALLFSTHAPSPLYFPPHCTPRLLFILWLMWHFVLLRGWKVLIVFSRPSSLHTVVAPPMFPCVYYHMLRGKLLDKSSPPLVHATRKS